MKVNRRAVLGFGTAATAAVTIGVTREGFAENQDTEPEPAAQSPEQARDRISRVYATNTETAGGTWNSYICVPDSDGTDVAAVADKADEVVEAYSVNKIAVAIAVLDKVDRGLLRLTQKIDVTDEIIVADGDGIFRLDGAYPSSATLGHALATLLTVSDDTAVRLCGLVCPAAEVNQILRDKGFTHTQVVPVANPNRFFLGTTTPRETHQLLHGLAAGTLLSAQSSAHLLQILRSPVAFTDGIRRDMSSDERLRIATKAGWFEDGRNEAGIIFDIAGKPNLIYSIFAHGQADPENFGATHPAVAARAVMGRKFFNTIAKLENPTIRMAAPVYSYQPSNGN